MLALTMSAMIVYASILAIVERIGSQNCQHVHFRKEVWILHKVSQRDVV